jgi:hypothetical protein
MIHLLLLLRKRRRKDPTPKEFRRGSQTMNAVLRKMLLDWNKEPKEQGF